jgi:hypothetical protein
MKRAIVFVGLAAAGWSCGNNGGVTDSVATENAGRFKVTAVVLSCPNITVFSASPAHAPVGGTITLAGEAKDVSNLKLTYYWTTTSGILADANRANTTYRCVSKGAATLTLTASNGVCSDEVTLDVACDEP